MPPPRYHTIAKRACCSLLLAATGCQLGPHALLTGHAQYNEAVRRINAEQMLLNLVRLRYRQRPIFLQIGSISTQFVFDQSGQILGTLNENVGAIGMNPDELSIRGNIGYQERPTITYNVKEGESFFESLLTPLTVTELALVSRAGWRGDRVMRLAVARMNGLQNAPGASGPTPSSAPSFRGFQEATTLLTELQRQRLVELDHRIRTRVLSAPIPLKALTSAALVSAAKEGAAFMATDDGSAYVLKKDTRVLVLRFSDRASQSPQAARLRELLHLDPGKSRFDLIDFDQSATDHLDPNALWSHLALDGRSMMGVMFYLSNAVHVPESDRAANRVTTTLNDDGTPFDWSQVLGDLFEVHVAPSRPANAAVAVRHRSHWFYIRDDDETSRSTFMLLGQLFALQGGAAEATKPLLTLPIGG